jgi:peptidyl-dipeptidase A
MKFYTWSILVALTAACASAPEVATQPQEPLKSAQDDPITFLRSAEAELAILARHEERATFLKGTDETDDHSLLQKEASELARMRRVALAKEAARFNGLSLLDETRRKLDLIKLAELLPPPSEQAKSAELAKVISQIERNYTSAANCTDRSPCRTKTELYDVMERSRDPQALLSAWQAWRAPARDVRAPYARMVQLANLGAQEIGYDDLTKLWQSAYDMPSDEFAKEYERLWDQVRPLYKAMHCHVRAKLRDVYGELVPENGLVPAHLFGNMWAQYWDALSPIVGPTAQHHIDLTALLNSRAYEALQMVRAAERFFMSLGFTPLPDSFWKRSMLVQLSGRKSDCQGYASPVDLPDRDVRIKMCVRVNERDFQTIHHELGHIYYYLAYADQPFLFQGGANPGFHEAIGDSIALSITPAYLQAIGLLDQAPSENEDLPFLFHTALNKIPQLAMAVVVDTWRRRVFSGEIPPDRYNEAWWDLRRTYQGMAPPLPRTEQDFDAGMFYHVAFNIPYDRYFVAAILQFDFHRALCEAAGYKGVLHRCSIFGSHEAGKRLKDTLALGASRPWPDALASLTGRRKIDASSVGDYFKPVVTWLVEQNEERNCGW